MAKHEKYFVDSSFIEHISWESKTKQLIITFASGSIWLYENIAKKHYNALCKAKSIGAYFNKNIRNTCTGQPIARVGKSSVIIYSKGDEIVETKKEAQEQE
ncbi:KTSC domain-containing protein [bacterium]|jgi:hypothetical protein|nr:KTSC domain-containing protein [Candidatus Elulimicrobium humile]